MDIEKLRLTQEELLTVVAQTGNWRVYLDAQLGKALWGIVGWLNDYSEDLNPTSAYVRANRGSGAKRIAKDLAEALNGAGYMRPEESDG